MSEVDVQRHLDVLTDEVHALRVRVEELLRERGVTDDTTFPGLLRAAASTAACASDSLRGAALFPLALVRATGERVVKCVQTRLPMPGQRAPAADPTWLDTGD